MRRWRPCVAPMLSRTPQFGSPDHLKSRSFRLGIGALSLTLAASLGSSAHAAEVSRGVLSGLAPLP